MISYESAKRLALKLDPRVNACREYDKGYFFFEKSDVDKDNDAGIAIAKDTGKAMSWFSFIT